MFLPLTENCATGASSFVDQQNPNHVELVSRLFCCLSEKLGSLNQPSSQYKSKYKIDLMFDKTMENRC